MKDVLDKVKFATSKTLTRMVLAALENATLQIEAQAMRFVGAKLPPIREESNGVAERFMQNIHNYFDELTTLVVKDTEIGPDDYDNLSLVDHDYLEAMIAMESMVKQMREQDIKGFKSFTTRLETLLPNIRIDETNNPLDPEQIGDCFNEAIRPLGLKAHYLLTIYREFNKTIFQHYDEVIDEANNVLIDLGVLPNLDITAKERELRKAKRAEARAQLEAETKAKKEAEAQELANRGRKKPAAKPDTESSNAKMFSMMQTLVKSLAEKQTGGDSLAVSRTSREADDLVAEQEDLRKQQTKLMAMLSDIQASMLNSSTTNGDGHTASVDAKSIGQSINNSIQADTSVGGIGAIDNQSSDVINLVTLLYEAIWKDKSLPVIMKELIGRTQISIMKVALTDTTFFDNENHPARALLNELALAGIAWTANDDPDSDPVYTKIKELVERILGEAEVNNQFLQGILVELRDFIGKQTGTDANLEIRLREADNYSENMDDVHAYVSQKVNERVLKGYLDPSIRNLLDTHLHNFLVKLIMREGPEGNSWKPIMSTIDVLLWTVQADKQPGDRERFQRINPRLLDNLGKALEIGGASKTKITKIMRQLKQVQEYSFHKAEITASTEETGADTSAYGEGLALELKTRTRKEPPPLPRDDPYLRRVDKFPVGTWFEFKGATGTPVRCSLASKIDSIDKLFFADKEGKKVVELTRMRLARELKAGSVKIVSEGSLVNRAMESVISNLQHTSSDNDNNPAQGLASA